MEPLNRPCGFPAAAASALDDPPCRSRSRNPLLRMGGTGVGLPLVKSDWGWDDALSALCPLMVSMTAAPIAMAAAASAHVGAPADGIATVGRQSASISVSGFVSTLLLIARPALRCAGHEPLPYPRARHISARRGQCSSHHCFGGLSPTFRDPAHRLHISRAGAWFCQR